MIDSFSILALEQPITLIDYPGWPFMAIDRKSSMAMNFSSMQMLKHG